MFTEHVLLPTAYVVREEVIFSVCLSVHTRGGGGTYLPDGGGGGVPTLRSGWWGGGTYLPRSRVGGGVPTLRSGWGGYLPSQVWVVGAYLSSGWGGTYSVLDGGVPT